MPVVPFIPAIAAGVGAVGSVVAANASNRGQQQAANASQAAANEATGEQRRQYDQSRQDNAPWLQTGQSALGQLAALYGLNGAQGGQSGGQNWNGYLQANPDVQTAISGGGFGGEGGLTGAAQRHFQEYGQAEGRAAPPAAGRMDNFFASPDYQFRQDESMRALTARNSALGIQDSGAAQRSALELSGNLASSEFNSYANRLSALAGVGQNAAGQNQQAGQSFAGAVGQIGMNNAQNLGSSYTNRADTNANLFGGLAGMGANLINSYRPQTPAPAAASAGARGSTYFGGLYR